MVVESVIPTTENTSTPKPTPTINLDNDNHIVTVTIKATKEAILPSNQDTPPKLQREAFVGDVAFVSRCCECQSSNIVVQTLPDGDTNFILEGLVNARQPVWSPDGQMLGLVSYGSNKQFLQVIDVVTKQMLFELQGFIIQFRWSSDGKSIFYLDAQENLYQYNLAEAKSQFLTKGVSHFSVSPDGQWLGLSRRESRQHFASFNFFTFRLLNLRNNNIFTISDDIDTGRLGSNRSIWSPVGNEIAVIFGGSTTQSSKIVVYGLQENHLQVKNTIIAPETYREDYGEDQFVNFTDIVWSPDGQKLLTIRSISETGGEVLLFDRQLLTYQRLQFGENITLLTWTGNSQWIGYTRSSDKNENSKTCTGPLSGEIWLANIETLETQIVVTNTLSIERPAWRP